jgi:hypothetical protein
VLRLRFFVPGLLFVMLTVFTRSAGRIVVTRVTESLRLARWLDAAERAAEFVNLAFVGELLAFGDLDEFEHFVEMINHLLEAIGNFSGVFHSLANGRGVGGFEIGITRTLRSQLGCRLAFNPLVALRPVSPVRAFRPLLHKALRRRADGLGAFAFHCCRSWLRNRSFPGHFDHSGFWRDFMSRRSGRIFRSGIGDRRVGRRRARAGATTTTTATSAAAAVGATRGGQVQIGLFVWD